MISSLPPPVKRAGRLRTTNVREVPNAILYMARKRHITTDTGGFLVNAKAQAADVRDRDGAPPSSLNSLLFGISAPR